MTGFMKNKIRWHECRVCEEIMSIQRIRDRFKFCVNYKS